jgi:hypothetical protein
MVSALPLVALRIGRLNLRVARGCSRAYRGQPPWRPRVVALALLLALTMWVGWVLVAAVPVRAAGSVSYEQRDYAVQVLPNGDVAVVERWKVHFAGGPFHHAFLQIYLARTTGIDFGTATGASAGTQQVSNSTDGQGNPVRRVEWDFPSTQDALRSFDIPYTIHGALGIGTSQAWLDWHFLDPGGQESFAVNESTVTVTLPAGSGCEGDRLGDTAGDQDGECKRCAGERTACGGEQPI